MMNWKRIPKVMAIVIAAVWLTAGDLVLRQILPHFVAGCGQQFEARYMAITYIPALWLWVFREHRRGRKISLFNGWIWLAGGLLIIAGTVPICKLQQAVVYYHHIRDMSTYDYIRNAFVLLWVVIGKLAILVYLFLLLRENGSERSINNLTNR